LNKYDVNSRTPTIDINILSSPALGASPHLFS
jgi:hypothetical protein